MKVTGYKLREAVRTWSLRRDAATSQFESTLSKFKDETKPAPVEVMSRIAVAEQAIAKLQVAQAIYNTRVSVAGMYSEPLTLLEAVKRVGPHTRAERMWRSAAGLETTSKRRSSLFSGILATRSKDNEIATPTITPDEAAKFAEAHGRELARLRMAIAAANTSEVELENLNAALFE